MNQIEMRVWRQSCHLFAPKSPNSSLDPHDVGRVYHKGKLLPLAECVGLCIAISQTVVWTVAGFGPNLYPAYWGKILAQPFLRLVHKLMQKLP